MSEELEKPHLTEDEIRLMMELYNIDEAGEAGLRDWLSYRDVDVTKEAAAQFSEIKKQFDGGLLGRKCFEERKKFISNDYDEKLDKKFRRFSAKWLSIIFSASAIFYFILWSLGLFSFSDERPVVFVIYQEARLVGIAEDFNLRLPSLKLEIGIQNDPVFRKFTKETNVSFIAVENYNLSVNEPMVDVLVCGERSRGLMEIEGKKLPLRPSSLEWIAVITFRDKEQEKKWLANIDYGRFILKQ
ncbi:MAG: hypothetical protein US76_00540 [Parcubacteria group bacterium GW2011_GWA2_38_13b]|nr:MAG: hypothetical protein US76_00540 [Parcubacteria group bacterium GW2011_GWA2_38_13b]